MISQVTKIITTGENTMSKKYEYKSKLFRKIHQLQKRLYRTEQNPGHSEDKVWFREMRIKKLINKIKERYGTTSFLSRVSRIGKNSRSFSRYFFVL